MSPLRGDIHSTVLTAQSFAVSPQTMAKKASSSSTDRKYTKPKLREQIKEDLKRSDKGGRKGQWSARKAQMLASEYKAQGGGFVGGKQQPQKSLDQWTQEKWTTADGKPARRGKKTTTRYLPKKAWASLSEDERKKTNEKKEAKSRTGRQFVGNTKKAKASRKKASASIATRKKKATKKVSAPRKKASKVSKRKKKTGATRKKKVTTRKKATRKVARRAPATQGK